MGPEVSSATLAGAGRLLQRENHLLAQCALGSRPGCRAKAWGVTSNVVIFRTTLLSVPGRPTIRGLMASRAADAPAAPAVALLPTLSIAASGVEVLSNVHVQPTGLVVLKILAWAVAMFHSLQS